MAEVWKQVFDIVRKIPRGNVATYGQISVLMGRRISAAAVGWALHVCPADVPWQRVVNRKGMCSKREGDGASKQQILLEAEGITFNSKGCLDLRRHSWIPD